MPRIFSTSCGCCCHPGAHVLNHSKPEGLDHQIHVIRCDTGASLNRPRHTQAEGKALVTNKQLTDWLVVQQQHLGFSLVPQFAADRGPARTKSVCLPLRQSVPVDLDKFEDWFEVAAIFISRVFLPKIQDLYPLHPILPRSKDTQVVLLLEVGRHG
jgi:hypothetical protein